MTPGNICKRHRHGRSFAAAACCPPMSRPCRLRMRPRSASRCTPAALIRLPAWFHAESSKARRTCCNPTCVRLKASRFSPAASTLPLRLLHVTARRRTVLHRPLMRAAPIFPPRRSRLSNTFGIYTRATSPSASPGFRAKGNPVENGLLRAADFHPCRFSIVCT